MDFLQHRCLWYTSHYNFTEREAGITVPVLPGIMPITSAAQMKRSQELSGTVFPRRFLAILDRFGSSPEAMKQAGSVCATDQIDLLANGGTIFRFIYE